MSAQERLDRGVERLLPFFAGLGFRYASLGTVHLANFTRLLSDIQIHRSVTRG